MLETFCFILPAQFAEFELTLFKLFFLNTNIVRNFFRGTIRILRMKADQIATGLRKWSSELQMALLH